MSSLRKKENDHSVQSNNVPTYIPQAVTYMFKSRNHLIRVINVVAKRIQCYPKKIVSDRLCETVYDGTQRSKSNQEPIKLIRLTQQPVKRISWKYEYAECHLALVCRPTSKEDGQNKTVGLI